jgi:glucose-1-phosphate thymidylyltransferase
MQEDKRSKVNQVSKGIILAGGSGTRLFPITRVACKQLLPIYDKPMVFYPLSTLMLFGIKDILLISTPNDLPRFEALLGDGNELGLSIRYMIQPEPKGIAQALILGESFIGEDSFGLVLGDNVFYGVYDFLREARTFTDGARIFGYPVCDPERYGVVEFDPSGKVLSLEEKPARPKSHYAITGLYLYDSQAPEIARGLKPSSRGELEITDVNLAYLNRGQLTATRLGRGIAWLDTGTHESMLDASNFIATIEKRQGQKIACLEEIAYRMKFISREQLERLIARMADNSYRDYLSRIVVESDETVA